MSDFTPRQYAAIAKVITDLPAEFDRQDLIEAFDKAFTADNPRYDAARFHAAAKGRPLTHRDER